MVEVIGSSPIGPTRKEIRLSENVMAWIVRIVTSEIGSVPIFLFADDKQN